LVDRKSRGVTPIAILSTGDFDATQVQTGSVRVGPNGQPRWTAPNCIELRRTDGADLRRLVFVLVTAAQRPRSHNSRQLH
jgi:hypothetical protein